MMMKNEDRSFFARVFRSFYFAFRGILSFVATPSNAWIHIPAAVAACTLGWFLKISKVEWFAILFSIGIVIICEMFNTALESLTDLVSPDYNKLAERTKDIAAGAVLVASLVALVVGGMIFVPKLIG
jgi:diacylglycerol kinase (ATP)